MRDGWRLPGVPHKGWALETVVDLGEGGDHVCDMCGQESIRRVHHLTHPQGHRVAVGCICAGHLTEDYELHRSMEKKLRRKAAALKRWPKLRWIGTWEDHRYSRNGVEVGVRHEGDDTYRWWIAKRWTPQVESDLFLTWEEAKLSLFEHYWVEINSLDQQPIGGVKKASGSWQAARGIE